MSTTKRENKQRKNCEAEINAERQFFDKIHSCTTAKIIFFMISMTIIMCVYLLSSLIVKERRDYKIMTEQKLIKDFDVIIDFEHIESHSREVKLSGWAIKNEFQMKNIHLVFQPVKAIENNIKAVVVHADINETVLENNQYKLNAQQGVFKFVADVSKRDLKENICYEIYAVIEYARSNDGEQSESVRKIRNKIFTDRFYYNGELYRYNPDELVSISCEDEYIKSVLTNGELYYADQESGCWVYLFDGKLHLFVNRNANFVDDSTHKVKFHIHTFQKELLPENRQEHGYESRGFVFKEEEYIISDESGYRVAIVELPKMYKISCIEMGLYEKNGDLYKEMTFSILDSEEAEK